ncbi:hypothetical protein VPMG_00062 [Vibrio phage VBP32]|uniref:Uncharacterized protein n=2 Tax=Stoningtonvirus VBP47 TaxID=2846606 RepID=M4SQP1_9CAUD|nr:hypothetical protein VPNG_00067 [Vibrio phage VBP47]YP_007676552.1 hypothetical protein VPMG_00062 [Vibrio phage VBP32]AGH57091.1 hypothetical protein VPNG_00067 [Vibrio phage VBP47]AGH57201.1 hypothetical protein VPMG_00062 [Vibrio phage VBP32]
MSTQMTTTEFKDALPAQMKKNVNQDLIDKVNKIMANDDDREQFRDNIVGMSYVLKEGKFKLESYVNAVRYITFTMMGKTNQESYALTFPDKMRAWNTQGKTAKDISSAVAIYNKSKLVNLVREAALIPAHIYNADVFQEAINVQAELMRSANSEKVRSDAANSLLTHLKRPETQKVELDIGVKEDSAIASLRDTTAKLVEQQKAMLKSGAMSAQEVAEQKMVIMEGEYEDITD